MYLPPQRITAAMEHHDSKGYENHQSFSYFQHRVSPPLTVSHVHNEPGLYQDLHKLRICELALTVTETTGSYNNIHQELQITVFDEEHFYYDVVLYGIGNIETSQTWTSIATVPSLVDKLVEDVPTLAVSNHGRSRQETSGRFLNLTLSLTNHMYLFAYLSLIY
ncbi:hypothetical protein BX666DRAFT_1881677 [Dichotomocladium elegans]|nr:hypothetical protein BX666DRAFT_1881677 [Dichotomocladium elegans]